MGRGGFFRLISLAVLLTLLTFAATAFAAPVQYASSSPWIASMVSFIGGDNVKVRRLSAVSSAGRLYAVGRPRASEIVIALDANEAARFRIKKTNPRLRLLYNSLPIPAPEVYSLFFDPASLPFAAQSVMKILAAEDKERYAFYQRRLAEFQSRVDSTIEIGRYMIGKAKILDITGAEGAWVRAAVPGAIRPPDEVWRSWLDGDIRALEAALAEATRRGWLIMLDTWTPAEIRAPATKYANRVTLPPPSGNKDYFDALQDIFMTISNAMKSQGK
jgi:hypothetical protein